MGEETPLHRLVDRLGAAFLKRCEEEREAAMQRCPCGHSVHDVVEGWGDSSEDAVRQAVGEFHSDYPPTFPDGKKRCPYCFAELNDDGSCGLSYEELVMIQQEGVK